MAGTSPAMTSARLARSRRCRREFQRNAVHAVAQPGRFRPVGEHVTKMAAAAMARHRGAEHAESAILALVHRMLQWRPETWPAGAAFEFRLDRKSTRLNSSHLVISYAVFCLKKKKIWKFSLKQLKKKNIIKQ